MPTNFSVEYRNPGHWDIYANRARVFCIRGEPGDFIVRDERRQDTGLIISAKGSFATVDAAMAWICSTLMFEKL